MRLLSAQVLRSYQSMTFGCRLRGFVCGVLFLFIFSSECSAIWRLPSFRCFQGIGAVDRAMALERIKARFDQIHPQLTTEEKTSLLSEALQVMRSKDVIVLGLIDEQLLRYSQVPFSRKQIKKLVAGNKIRITSPLGADMEITLEDILPDHEIYIEREVAERSARIKAQREFILNFIEDSKKLDENEERFFRFLYLGGQFHDERLGTFSIIDFKKSLSTEEEVYWDEIVVAIQNETQSLERLSRKGPPWVAYFQLVIRHSVQILNRIDSRLHIDEALGESYLSQQHTVDYGADELDSMIERAKEVTRSRALQVSDELKQRLVEHEMDEIPFFALTSDLTERQLREIQQLDAEVYAETRQWFLDHIKDKTKDLRGVRAKSNVISYLNELSESLGDRELKAKRIWPWLR